MPNDTRGKATRLKFKDEFISSASSPSTQILIRLNMFKSNRKFEKTSDVPQNNASSIMILTYLIRTKSLFHSSPVLNLLYLKYYVVQKYSNEYQDFQTEGSNSQSVKLRACKSAIKHMRAVIQVQKGCEASWHCACEVRACGGIYGVRSQVRSHLKFYQ